MTSDERTALTESAQAEGLLIEHFVHAPVACTIVEALDGDAANLVAVGVIAEVLDVLEAFEVGGRFSRNEILVAGFVRDLQTGQVNPGVSSPMGQMPGKAFKVKTLSWEPLDKPRLAFYLRNSELSEQIRRSTHWWRRARSTHDAQLGLLWRWFAIEALCRISRADTDINPRVRWFLGFPAGGAAGDVPRELVKRWSAQQGYDLWRRQILAWLEDIRSFRNNSVHSGFRVQDIELKRLQRLIQVADVACINLHRAAYRALELGATARQDLFDYINILFSEWDPDRVFGFVVTSLS